jgi:branched-subunit amino acid transport protein
VAPASGVSATTVWLVVLAVAVGTLAYRLSFFVLLDRVGDLPPLLERGLAYLPPAVFAAIALPGVVLLDGTLALSVANERLVAAAVAAVVAWRTGSLVATVVVGMGVVLLVGAL